MKCHKCGEVDPALSWRTFTDGRRHIEAKCPACRAFLGWAEQTPVNVSEADHAASKPDDQKLLF